MNQRVLINNEWQSGQIISYGGNTFLIQEIKSFKQKENNQINFKTKAICINHAKHTVSNYATSIDNITNIQTGDQKALVDLYAGSLIASTNAGENVIGEIAYNQEHAIWNVILENRTQSLSTFMAMYGIDYYLGDRHTTPELRPKYNDITPMSFKTKNDITYSVRRKHKRTDLVWIEEYQNENGALVYSVLTQNENKTNDVHVCVEDLEEYAYALEYIKKLVLVIDSVHFVRLSDKTQITLREKTTSTKRSLNESLLSVIIAVQAFQKLRQAENQLRITNKELNYDMTKEYYNNLPAFILQAAGLKTTTNDFEKVLNFDLTEKILNTDYAQLEMFEF